MEIRKITEEGGQRSRFFFLLKWCSGHRALSLACSLLLFCLLLFVLQGGLSSPGGAIKNIVYSVGKDVLSDDRNHTNILLLGIGGLNHDGSDLTDTVIIASLDHDEEKVSLLSLPRDLYFKTDLTGGMRLNGVYESAKKNLGSSSRALNYLKEQLGAKLGLEIHYYAKIDFAGFKQTVDALGGVEVEVKEDIYDPSYPRDGTIEYQPFAIERGLRLLDGETALKYVRSRKSTSDFDRSRRQQQVIAAIKDKALSLRTFTSPSRLRDLYDSLAANHETDLTWREILYLAEFAEKIGKNDKIIMNVLHDDPGRAGGILYTPLREFYGGMFVLLPLGDDYANLARYADFVLYNPRVLAQKISLQILNGSKSVGRAARIRQKLQLLGLNVPRYGNARSLEIPFTSLYVRNPEIDSTVARFWADFLGARLVSIIPSEYNEVPYRSNADLILEIGADFIDPE